MAYTIRPVEYYYVNVRDELGAAYRVLSALAARGVSLLAFTAVPSGPSLAQFALFPEDPNKLVAEARAAQIALDGPHHALLVQGDDELGALAAVHERLFKARRGRLRVLGGDGLARLVRLRGVCPRGPVPPCGRDPRAVARQRVLTRPPRVITRQQTSPRHARRCSVAAVNLVWGALVVVAVTAVTVTVMLVVRRTAPEGSYFKDGDRASGVFGVLATGFSVLLGFIIFLAFTSYDQSRSGAEDRGAGPRPAGGERAALPARPTRRC